MYRHITDFHNSSVRECILSTVTAPYGRVSGNQIMWRKVWHGCQYWPLARYVKLRVSRAAGMAGSFSPPPPVRDPDMHHDTYVTHVPWCMPGLLTTGFLWSRSRGKRSRHTRRMRNPQLFVSGRRPMAPGLKMPSYDHSCRCLCIIIVQCRENIKISFLREMDVQSI